MKKLILSTALVCATLVSSASGYKWYSGMSGGIMYAGSDTKLYDFDSTATLYLFMDVTQSSIYEKLAKDPDITKLGAIKTTGLSTASKITTLEFDDAAYKGTHNFFFATLMGSGDNQKVYLSSMKENIEYLSVGAGALMYTDLANSKTVYNDSTTSFSGAGWYSVPEPTSGLLLLCGLAGLMLRRKQKQA